MYPRRDAISCRPNLLITDDGPVKSRLLGPAAVVDPCGNAAGWRLVLYAATDFGVVEALQDDFQRRRGQQNSHRPSVPPFCASAIPPQGVAITADGVRLLDECGLI
jgi:hypothetical protein